MVPGAGDAIVIAECAGTGAAIRSDETYFRYNGRTYCREEMARMFPEVFKPRMRRLYTVLGWGGVIGGPLLATGILVFFVRAGVRPGRAAGLFAHRGRRGLEE